MEKLYLGIDIGSTTLKAVLLSESGKVKHSIYQRTKPVGTGKVKCTGHCNKCGACSFGALRKTIDGFLSEVGLKSIDEVASTAVTGSQIVEETKNFIPYDFRVSEVSAHVAGAQHYHPQCKAILDVGGQDSKAMIFNDKMGLWNSKMSGICAAGTGAFLDSVAVKLNIPVEELADRANYDSELEFSSVCAVLSATSINKFKNRFPLDEIIGGACRAQARTIMSGVGEIFFGYKGDIIFQGGVAYNRAVAYYLKQITGNNIIIPEFNGVMGALGAACLARQHTKLAGRLASASEILADKKPLKSIQMRAKSTRKEFLSRSSDPMVWRNLFFPTEILNAMNLKMLTLETYAALFARSPKKIKRAFDSAACKGYSSETCSFLRALEGMELPKPDFGVSTSQPCQQGERVFRDLFRSYEMDDKFFSLHTPLNITESAIENMAQDLEYCVDLLEKETGRKMDLKKLAEACELSNEARHYSKMCNELRFHAPPLISGTQMVYFSVIFSQLWGRQELVDIQKQLYEDLKQRRDEIGDTIKREDTHRILWLHLPPFYDSSLLNYIEQECNAPIVFEEVNFIGWDALDPKDPYRSLARKLLTVGFLDPNHRVKTISKRSSEAGFNGCILYNHGFGRCSMSDASFMKHLREELNDASIPLLVLDGDCVDPTIDPCSTYTKVSSYIESLNEKKYGNIFGPVMK
ncbi:2-hydroxyacyl-CoA dehydratase [Lentisphaerota bacterium ZTH]|nr:2-hydroxyacyl-CoA dehydratase [Lentisphaerota bacterium]WET07349.1 2-hydroxyacyl-CoA dehydratase [Lentisphaerota bacterium ZTH]